ncbi:hypothetical protein K474DRAFT_1772928 [Panus rudis PR-1116 ss-1]|nr:hypothetical protein K474DRAFT_1772928 [Panus rudis PR-1116 ss-1]
MFNILLLLGVVPRALRMVFFTVVSLFEDMDFIRTLPSAFQFLQTLPPSPSWEDTMKATGHDLPDPVTVLREKFNMPEASPTTPILLHGSPGIYLYTALLVTFVISLLSATTVLLCTPSTPKFEKKTNETLQKALKSITGILTQVTLDSRRIPQYTVGLSSSVAWNSSSVVGSVLNVFPDELIYLASSIHTRHTLPVTRCIGAPLRSLKDILGNIASTTLPTLNIKPAVESISNTPLDYEFRADASLYKMFQRLLERMGLTGEIADIFMGEDDCAIMFLLEKNFARFFVTVRLMAPGDSERHGIVWLGRHGGFGVFIEEYNRVVDEIKFDANWPIEDPARFSDTDFDWDSGSNNESVPATAAQLCLPSPRARLLLTAPELQPKPAPLTRKFILPALIPGQHYVELSEENSDEETPDDIIQREDEHIAFSLCAADMAVLKALLNKLDVERYRMVTDDVFNTKSNVIETQALEFTWVSRGDLFIIDLELNASQGPDPVDCIVSLGLGRDIGLHFTRVERYPGRAHEFDESEGETSEENNEEPEDDNEDDGGSEDGDDNDHPPHDFHGGNHSDEDDDDHSDDDDYSGGDDCGGPSNYRSNDADDELSGSDGGLEDGADADPATDGLPVEDPTSGHEEAFEFSGTDRVESEVDDAWCHLVTEDDDLDTTCSADVAASPPTTKDVLVTSESESESDEDTIVYMSNSESFDSDDLDDQDIPCLGADNPLFHPLLAVLTNEPHAIEHLDARLDAIQDADQRKDFLEKIILQDYDFVLQQSRSQSEVTLSAEDKFEYVDMLTKLGSYFYYRALDRHRDAHTTSYSNRRS